MGKRLNLLLIVFGTVLLYACYYFVLPVIIDLEKLNPYIVNYIKKEYGYSIKIEHPDFKMGYSPSIWLKADKFELLNNDKTLAMSLEEPVIKIDLIPLILSHVNVRYFSAKDVFADFYYDNKRNVTLGQYIVLRSTNPYIKIKDSKIFVNKFRANLNDKIKKENAFVLGKYFNIDEYKVNKSLKASFNFEIISGKTTSSINFNADTKLPFKRNLEKYPPELSFSVANLSLSKFNNFINYFSEGSISDIGGIINLDIRSDKSIFQQKQYLSDILIDNFYIKTKLFGQEYHYPYKVHIKSNYLLNKNELKIPSFSVSSPKLSAKLSGVIDKVSSRKPVPNIDFKMFDMRAEDILDVIPYCAKLDEFAKFNISVLKKSKLKSNIDADINLKDSFEKPNLSGYVDITDAFLDRPIKNSPKNADIKLLFDKSLMNIKLNVPTDKDQNVSLSGTIDFFNTSDSHVTVSTTNAIDLSEAERVLIPMHETFDFLLGPIPIMSLSGYGSANLKISGNKKEPHIFGSVNTFNSDLFFNDIPDMALKKAETVLSFDDKNIIFVAKNGMINDKKAFISGNFKLNGEFDFNVKLPQLDSDLILRSLKSSKILSDISNAAKFLENVTGLCELNAKIYGNITSLNDIKFGKNLHIKGDISLKTVRAKLLGIVRPINNIFGKIVFDDYDIDLNVSSFVGASKLDVYGNINSDTANINFKLPRAYISDLLNTIAIKEVSVNRSRAKDLSTVELTGKYYGDTNKFNLNNLKLDGKLNFKNCNLIYNPYKMPVTISNGIITIKNNYMFLSKISAVIGTMPAVIGGHINNFVGNSYFDLSIFTRPNQKFIDYIYNSSSVYPIKIKGKSVVTATLSGYKNKLNIKSNLNLDKDSSLYYMGATIGGEERPVGLVINSSIEPSQLNIRQFNYNKGSSPQLSASGVILNSKNNTSFSNLKINTYVPTDMKIFNILFKKPFIKRGKFNASLVLNGNLKEPVVRGYLNLFDLDIPFINSNINSILLKFTQDNIISTIKGNVLENVFTLNFDAKNKLKPPYIINSANFNSEKLDINTIYEAIKEFELNNTVYEGSKNISKFDLKQLIIKHFDVTADSVLINKIKAKNLKAIVSLNSNKLKIDDFKFQMAKGQMKGAVAYNLDTFASAFNLSVTGADSDILLDTIFDLKGQIYGDLDGELDFTCTGSNQEKCIKTLDGKAAFRVKNGRMPKLGSLEYLLKAGNLMKSGITGLSMNGFMDFIVPLKTGSFDTIKGSVDINKGIMDKIQISSEGKDLNLFIIGEYDIAAKYANMYVFGRLSRKISTILGPVGNLSLNTLFNTIPGVNLSKTSDTGLVNNINKIPGLELSNKAFRVFAAEIRGNISGDDYVESFRWIE